jgi:hypothetical protein
VRLAALGPDEHAKAARVRVVDACLARELVDRLVGDDRDRTVWAVDGAPGRVGAREAQLTARVVGERLCPRPLHDPPALVAVVEPGRDRITELHATVDDRAVRERERERVGVGLPLRGHGEERSLQLRQAVDEAAALVEQVEPAILDGAERLEVQLLAPREREALDRRN